MPFPKPDTTPPVIKINLHIDIYPFSFGFIIINYPLPDEADYRLVLDMNVKNNASILLLVHHEKLKSIEDRMQKAGIMTVGKPIHQHTLFQLLKFAILTQRKQKQHQKQ